MSISSKIEVFKLGNGDTLIIKKNDSYSVVLNFLHEALDSTVKLLKSGFSSFLQTFHSYNPIDFLIYFYVGYLVGISILLPFEFLEKGRFRGLLFIALLYYPTYIACCFILKHPASFGALISITLITLLNILQRPKGITYKDLALIFPIFRYIKNTKINSSYDFKP